MDKVGRPDLAGDPRFATGQLRGENRAALTESLDAAMSAKTTAEWIEILSGALPVAPIHDVAGALANPFVAEVDMVRHVPHPLRPDFRLLANPLRIKR